jgi:hypothetical protein
MEPGSENHVVAIPFDGIPRRMSFRLGDVASTVLVDVALYWDGVAVSPDRSVVASDVRLVEHWKGALVLSRGDHILQAVVSWHEVQPKCSCLVRFRVE